MVVRTYSRHHVIENEVLSLSLQSVVPTLLLILVLYDLLQRKGGELFVMVIMLVIVGVSADDVLGDEAATLHLSLLMMDSLNSSK